MKVICTQENLRNGLTQVSRVIGSSVTLPILNNLLLETSNGQLKISATNLEIGISTAIRCKIESEGSACVPAKVLLDLVQNLPSDNITMEVLETEMLITTKRYETKIKHLPAEDFPLIPTVTDASSITLPAETLKQAFDSTAFSTSSSETQPEISGVMFKVENNLMTITATDRYRLAEMTTPVQSNLKKTIIIPQKSALELSRLLTGVTENVSLQITDTQISLTVGDTYLVSRLIDGSYPEYSQIIPTEGGTVILTQHSQLLAALKTSGIFSKGAGSVTIVYDTEKQILQIMSASQGVGESNVEIPCEISGDSGSVILNYRYILDLLVNTSQEALEIHIIDDSSPVVFRPPEKSNYLYLIMPIRL
jgi:DNA polymerase III subunit beta